MLLLRRSARKLVLVIGAMVVLTVATGAISLVTRRSAAPPVLAGTTGCYAVAMESGTYPNGIPETEAAMPAEVKTALDTLGYSLDDAGVYSGGRDIGCVLLHGQPAYAAPIVAYEPGDTSATSPTYSYEKSAGCGNQIAITGQYPASLQGPTVVVTEEPTAAASGTSTCVVTFSTSPAAASAPSIGNGIVPVVVGSPTPAPGGLYTAWACAGYDQTDPQSLTCFALNADGSENQVVSQPTSQWPPASSTACPAGTTPTPVNTIPGPGDPSPSAQWTAWYQADYGQVFSPSAGQPVSGGGAMTYCAP